MILHLQIIIQVFSSKVYETYLRRFSFLKFLRFYRGTYGRNECLVFRLVKKYSYIPHFFNKLTL